MVTFKLTAGNATLTEEERKMVKEAKKLPVIFDEESPELTEEMKKAFIAARKATPRSAL